VKLSPWVGNTLSGAHVVSKEERTGREGGTQAGGENTLEGLKPMRASGCTAKAETRLPTHGLPTGVKP
jgi:hypothetical protein